MNLNKVNGFLKIIAIFLSVCFLCGFVACNTNDTKVSSDVMYNGNVSHGIHKDTVLSYIVKDNMSEYVIVVPDDCDACISYAAEELSNYIFQSTNTNISIKKSSEVPLTLMNKYISLGDTDVFSITGIKIDDKEMNDGGFIMRSVNNNLFIAGAQSSGVLYGVYDFCEQVLGIRFITAENIYIPELNNVPLYKIDRIEIPAFSNRDYYAYQSMNDKEFAAKLRLESAYNKVDAKYGNGGSNSFFVGDGHTVITKLLPYNKYGELHPDWYTQGHNELCYTNGLTSDGKIDFNNKSGMAFEMFNVCINAILKNPNARYLMLGQEDNSAWCNCAKCQKSDAENGGKSGTLMIFVNAMAEAIENYLTENNLDIDVTVVTFAYWKTIDPPVVQKNGVFVPVNDKVVARDNVAVKMAWMGCFSHAVNDENCSINKIFKRRFENWSLITDRMTVWDYATNFDDHFFWFENLDALVKNYKYYRSIGVENVMSQGAPHVGNYYQGHLENYVVAKLLWNPDYNVNELIREFNYYYYGESSGVVNEFVSLMRSHYKTCDDELNHGLHCELYTSYGSKDFEHFPLAYLEKMCKLIKDEIERVVTLPQSDQWKEQQVDKLLQVYIQPQYMILANYDAYYDPLTKVDYAKGFFQNCDRLKIKYYGEGKTINDLKTTYGVV